MRAAARRLRRRLRRVLSLQIMSRSASVDEKFERLLNAFDTDKRLEGLEAVKQRMLKRRS